MYLGVKPRSDEPLLMGLMWLGRQRLDELRHTCEHGDRLGRYGWVRHDGQSYGQQELIDGGTPRCAALAADGSRQGALP